MKNVFSMKTLSVVAVLSIALLYSCKKDNEDSLSSTDSQNVNSESVSASATSETADVGNSIITGLNDTKLNSNTRVAGYILGETLDARLKGAKIYVIKDGASTWSHPIGVIKIDFGTGVTDAAGVTRKGIIYIAYDGRRWAYQSTRKITFSYYYRNGIRVQGLYTVTNVTADSLASPFTFHHKLDTGKLTFPASGSNGETYATRNAEYDVKWTYVANTPAQSTMAIVNGDRLENASGVTRKGVAYSMVIGEPITYRVGCVSSGVFMPSSGSKTVTVGLNTPISYTIDYGNGDCDNRAVITIGTRSVTINVDPGGN